MYASLKIFGLASGLAAVANAHTTFTTAFINGENQGDGICVRMPTDSSTATYPIASITSNDMVCGRDGTNPSAFTCPAPQGATVSFWWREWPDYSNPGAVDSSHKGPCAVYVKQVANASADSGVGDGWFKIWEEGYDTSSKKWCTEKLIENQGLLNVKMPSGLPTGDYLVRPELLALHEAYTGDPQFYVGCLQLHVTGSSEGTLSIPSANSVSIPGYVDMSTPDITYNIYEGDGFRVASDYKTPGPAVYYPTSSSSSSSLRIASTDGSTTSGDYAGVPADCLIENGDWCGVEVSSYSTEAGCWAASDDCFSQESACYDKALPIGSANCGVWDKKCMEIQDACNGGNFNGPPNKNVKLTRVDANLPSGASLSAWNSGSSGSSSSSSSSGGNTPNVATASSSSSSSSVAVDDTPASTDETSTSTTTEAAKPTGTSDNNQGNNANNPDENAETVTASSSTSSAAASEPTGGSSDGSGLKVSEDGRCGGATGQTCEGSQFGSCCSKKGYCGSTRKHCSCGCRKGFGTCNGSKKI